MTATPAPRLGERVTAPFGRRRCEVTRNLASGGYRIFSALDPAGPEPAAGQFYMLATDSGWGGDGGRPYLARAFSVADAAREGDGVRLDFLVQAVGPGTSRLAALEAGEGLWIHGPLGRPFSAPSDVADGAAGAILVGGGIGVAPLAIWRRQLLAAGIPARVLLGFRDRANSGGLDLFDCSEIRLASEDGHTGHRGFVTDLLAVLLEGDDAAQRGDLRLRPAGHARGGAGDVRGARRRLRAGDGGADGLRLRRLLRLRDPPQLRRLHASLRRRPGGPRRRDRDGAGAGIGPLMEGNGTVLPDPDLSTEFCGLALRHPVINGSGTFDAIAARRAFGDRLLDEFPFSAFVSKTITPEPRAGNPPPRLWETPSGLINSIGLPNKGLDGFLSRTCRSSQSCRCR